MSATASNSDDYLRKYIDSKDDIDNNTGLKSSLTEQHKEFSSVKDLQFMAINVEELPCKWFYAAGTTVMVRPADIKEIQAFSVVNETNFYDIFEKVNYMISKCVFLKLPDGRKVPHTHLVDGDRWYMLFIIRDLTFQKGTELMTKADDSGDMIPIKRGNFRFHEMEPTLEKYYDKVNGVFDIKTKIGDFTLAPPKIGLQKSFTDYMLEIAKKGETIDKSFLKIIPYTLTDRLSITKQGIEKYLKEYEIIGKPEFQVLNQLVEKMKFGIKSVSIINESGEEVHSTNMFPDGIAGLFVEHDTLSDYLI